MQHGLPERQPGDQLRLVADAGRRGVASDQGLSRRKVPPLLCVGMWPASSWMKKNTASASARAPQVANAMAAKVKLLQRELKTLKADLAFSKERCAQLEEENRQLRDGNHDADEDMVRARSVPAAIISDSRDPCSFLRPALVPYPRYGSSWRRCSRRRRDWRTRTRCTPARIGSCGRSLSTTSSTCRTSSTSTRTTSRRKTRTTPTRTRRRRPSSSTKIAARPCRPNTCMRKRSTRRPARAPPPSHPLTAGSRRGCQARTAATPRTRSRRGG
jgi:hypothetical protein